MPKLNASKAICEADLTDYLDESSDFAFELKCVELLSSLRSSGDYPILHGGSYVDPVTGKDRQYDIRVREMESSHGLLWLAIECKNLRASFPLLVSRVPRLEGESYHHFLTSNVEEGLRCATVENRSTYRIGEPVGKDCCQVGRDLSGNLFNSSTEVFEKWSQALASSRDMFLYAVDGFDKYKEHFPFASLILPIVVVPDGCLWAVDFNADGSRPEPPRQVERCNFYVAKGYSERVGDHTVGLQITHLEFVTFTGLRELVQELKSEVKWFHYHSPRWHR